MIFDQLSGGKYYLKFGSNHTPKRFPDTGTFVDGLEALTLLLGQAVDLTLIWSWTGSYEYAVQLHN